MVASRRYRWQGDGSYLSAGGGERDVPGQDGFEVDQLPLTSGLTSVPNPVRPRHVGDRSRVLRTRDLSASFLQSKR